MLLLLATARRKRIPRRREWRPLARGGRRRLTAYVLTTTLAGYGGFLAIVLVFYVLIAGQSLRTLWNAFTSGGLLAFCLVVPVFLGLTALEDIARGRWKLGARFRHGRK
jgi:hypothetical protein